MISSPQRRPQEDDKPFEECGAWESESAGFSADHRFDPQKLGGSVVVGGEWSTIGFVIGGIARVVSHLSVLRSLLSL